jgi:hypothetical protein
MLILELVKQAKNHRVSLTLVEISINFGVLVMSSSIDPAHENYEPEKLRDMIVDMAIEFEELYGNIITHEQFETINELNNPLSYIEAVIAFTSMKFDSYGWIKIENSSKGIDIHDSK